MRIENPTELFLAALVFLGNAACIVFWWFLTPEAWYEWTVVLLNAFAAGYIAAAIYVNVRDW